MLERPNPERVGSISSRDPLSLQSSNPFCRDKLNCAIVMSLIVANPINFSIKIAI